MSHPKDKNASKTSHVHERHKTNLRHVIHVEVVKISGKRNDRKVVLCNRGIKIGVDVKQWKGKEVTSAKYGRT